MWPALSAAKNALTEKGPASKPASRGPAGNRVGVAKPDAEFEAQMKRMGDLAREGADLRGKAAADTKVTDYANQRREFDKTNVLNVPDPMNSRAISDAMIAFGGKLLASEGRDVGGGVQEGGKAWMAGRTRNEDQAGKERDFRLKAFMDTMGLSQKDAESLTAKDKAVLEAALAGIGAKGVDIAPRLDYAKEGRKEAHELEKADRQGQWHVRSAQASHASAQKDPFAIVDAYKKRMGALGQALTPDQETQMMTAMMKQPKDARYDKERAAVAKDALTSLVTGKVPKGQEDAVTAQFVIDVAEGTHTIEEAKEGLRRKLLALQGGGK
jgi:hypothetical protein